MANQDCFGKFWEPHAPECYGGREPASGRMHPRCDVYEQCSREFRMKQAAVKLQQMTQPAVQTVPLIRPPTMGQSLTPPQQQGVYAVPRAVPPQPTPRPGYQVPPQQPLALPQTQFYPAVYHPVQALQPNESPAYLTVLEPQLEGSSMWGRVFAESVRAAMKGVLTHGAYVVDHAPLYYLPPAPAQVQEKK